MRRFAGTALAFLAGLLPVLPLHAFVPREAVGRQQPTVNPSAFNCPALITHPTLITDIYAYNCCQPSTRIDRHGVTNFFTYYGNKRLTSSPVPFDAQTSTALAHSCLGEGELATPVIASTAKSSLITHPLSFSSSTMRSFLPAAGIRCDAGGLPASAPGAAYFYDSFGRRIAKHENGALARYVWDGMEIIGAATARLAGSIDEYYTRGPGVAGDVGSLVAETRLGIRDHAVRWIPVILHHNHRGDVVLATDGDGAVVGEFGYTAFGEPVPDGVERDPFDPPPYAPRFGFSSKERDASGLVYFGFRYYSPDLCRWISEDPIGEEGGLNLYGFCGNDPVNWTDPYGLDIWLEGSSGGEPIPHQSINVGNPYSSQNISYSYGANGCFNWRNGVEGEPYPDIEKGGAIIRYKTTTAEQDAEFLKILRQQSEKKSAYGISDTCRTWSQRNFENAPGTETMPPPRTPAPRSWFRRQTVSSVSPTTTTSSTGTSTSR